MPSRANEDSLEQSCRYCLLPDNNRMVSCDDCKQQFHFECVGITEAQNNWSCQECSQAKIPAPQTPLSVTNKPSAQVAHESQAQWQLSHPCPTTSRVPVSQPSIPQVPVVPVHCASDQRIDPDLVNKLPTELRIKLLEEEEALERKFLLRRYQLLLESSGGTKPTGENRLSEDASGINDTVPAPACHSSPLIDQRPSVPVSVSHQINQHPSVPVGNPRPSVPVPTVFPPNRRSSGAPFSLPIGNQQPNTSTGRPRYSAPEDYPYELPGDDPSALGGTSILNRSQIAARHAVSKELPIFNGEPEEWPLFFATFENTTNICGFTPEENMARLQRCLKGKALEAVKCQLLHPANLEQVLSTLRMLFGRPEIIVHSLLQKVNALPAPKADRLGTLVDFALAVRNMVATVKACNLQEYLCNLTLLHSLTERLPPMVLLNWATHRQSLQVVTLAEFSDWLYKLVEAASAVTMPQFSGSSDTKAQRSRKDGGFLNAHTETFPKPKQHEVRAGCVICNGSCEAADKCKRFNSLDHSTKWNVLREYKLCRSCLGNHRGPCKSSNACGKNGCQFKHHRLLHNDAKDKEKGHQPSSTNPQSSQSSHSSQSSQSTTAANSQQTEFTCNTHRGGNKTVLFQYVPVVLHSNGAKLLTHAFLDSGSSLTLMEEDLAKQLNLRGEKHPLCLRWTADTCRYENDAMRVTVDISGTRTEDTQHRLLDVYTVKELKLPSQSLPVEKLSKKYHHLKGLSLDSYTNVQPKILIGMNNVRMAHALDSREGRANEPVAVKTRLGWTIYGTCSPNDGVASDVTPCSYHICFHSYEPDELLHETVKNFFTLDSLGISAPQNQRLSKEDERALEKLREVTTIQNGRFQVALLWRHDGVRLPNNRSMAVRRHHCLLKRMEREPQLAEILKSKMVDYESKGYIRKLTPEESRQTGDRIWYLPIFPVFNPNKPGKVRIVFDAAASFAGVSLNSVLMKGPDQLNSLPPVLYKFRERAVGLGGDIAEMFHQMLMNPLDQDSQRILWTSGDGSKETCDYVVQVVTFGATCSPSTALFVLNRNADRFETVYPTAVDTIRCRHYVDDMITSVDSEEEAIKLAKEVRYIHHQGGFHIRNWVSNSPAVIEALGETQKPEMSMDMNSELAMEKILGMWWSTATDVFRYKLNTERNRELLVGAKHPTKRDVLRTLMAVYDPLGLIGHYLMYLKVLLQEVWRSGSGWDDPIGETHYEKWTTWLRILPELESIEIPRCYFRPSTSLDKVKIELHTFTDASELGYAAVSYLRFEENGVAHCVLVGSKTRVAPIKFVSIPRLELQAAVIGARLAKSIIEGHSIKIDRRYFWTDARNVMCWLHSDHRRYSQFVAFRVGEILEITDVSEWNWLDTKTNVADDGTKWKLKPDLKPSSRWFNGPPFLWKSKDEWPVSTKNVAETLEEIRPSLLHHSEESVCDILLPQNFSSWKRLQRVTALLLRFARNYRRKKAGQPVVDGPYTQDELIEAEVFQISRAQTEVYRDELTTLKGKKQLPKKNRLYNVSPFVDDRGVMRIHSRLGECDFVDNSTGYPIILPRDHSLTRLIVDDVHRRYHHQCRETYVNEVRKRYYIPRVRVVCDLVRRNCQVCKILRAMPSPPAMAPLPKERLAAFVRPFSYVGVDFFGPFLVAVGRHHEKRWGVIITCLTVRAVHIELATSLSTTSCIIALRNCFGRRGTPLEIISDRGTNFVGANRELRDAVAKLDRGKLMQELTTSTTSWRFNPPAAPHMGGAWERLIQSIKKVLSQVKPTKVTTEELLRSYLVEVENIINSRPLTHVPVDDISSPALTPNHFLLGSSDGLKPLVPFDDHPATLKQSWVASQVLANHFWKRWVADYLPILTRRTKWFYPAKPIAVGDLVLIVDPSSPRNCWPKGRVVSVKTSVDGQVRSALVQAASGLYERPAVKLAVLDVGANRSKPDQGPPTGGGLLRPLLVRRRTYLFATMIKRRVTGIYSRTVKQAAVLN